jgi:Xaa-Pro aminopeptidase
VAAQGLDALVVTAMPNILYLTNFGGSAAIVVLTETRLLFLTDARYTTAVADAAGTAHECPGLELVPIDGSYDATLARVLASLPAGQVGFEALEVTVARHQWLTGRLDDRHVLVPSESVVERLRTVKDSYEIGVLAEGGRLLSKVAAEVLASEVRPGRTEREVALAVDTAVRRAGFERAAFDTIVASGPHAALPHARPDERILSEGDLVLLDFGGVYDSYCVDLTRTVSIGRASERAQQVHAAVLAARNAAIAAAGPGVSRFAVDAAAREVLVDAGMGDAFGHGTGHGLGIEVHERPRVGRRGPDVDTRDEWLAAGMVFTIEPGAYFPGWGGVRIEDDVVVTASGVDLLTDVTTNLLEL